MLTKRTVTYYTCTLCQKDQDENTKMTSFSVKLDGAYLHYDVCPDCMEKKVQRLLDSGETRGAGGKPAVTAPIKKRVAAAKKSTSKKLKAVSAVKPLERNADGLYECPDCKTYPPHERANVVANHRRREHNYVSPRKAA